MDDETQANRSGRVPGLVPLSRSGRAITVLHGEEGDPPVVRFSVRDQYDNLDGVVLLLTPDEADDVAHRLRLCAIYARRWLTPPARPDRPNEVPED